MIESIKKIQVFIKSLKKLKKLFLKFIELILEAEKKFEQNIKRVK